MLEHLFNKLNDKEEENRGEICTYLVFTGIGDSGAGYFSGVIGQGDCLYGSGACGQYAVFRGLLLCACDYLCDDVMGFQAFYEGKATDTGACAVR